MKKLSDIFRLTHRFYFLRYLYKVRLYKIKLKFSIKIPNLKIAYVNHSDQFKKYNIEKF